MDNEINKKLIIGITGNSGSGKSFFSKKLGKIIGANVIDVDKIAHKVINEKDVKSKIVEKFGSQIIEDNKIVRKRLSNIVFKDNLLLNYLEEITYLKIKEFIIIKIKKCASQCIIDYSLLPDCDFWESCDIKLLINAQENVRLKRLRSREHITKTRFELREKNAMNYNKFSFDYVIANNGKDLMEDINNIIQIIENKKNNKLF